MTMLAERIAALELLREHPGWSDARVARELKRRRLPASPDSVTLWRRDAGLAPATSNVTTYPPPRRAGVLLNCGHLVHPEHVDADGRARCDYCGAARWARV